MHIEATRRNYIGVKILNRLTVLPTALLFMILGMLSGCATLDPSSNGSAKVEDVQIDPALQRQLYKLEDQAELAIKRNHLAYPRPGSAVNLFEQMLALNPGNKEAIRGLEQVVEEYIALALAAANERLFAKAKSMLARAKLVDADHPSLAPTMTQISLLEKSQTQSRQIKRQTIVHHSDKKPNHHPSKRW